MPPPLARAAKAFNILPAFLSVGKERKLSDTDAERVIQRRVENRKIGLHPPISDQRVSPSDTVLRLRRLGPLARPPLRYELSCWMFCSAACCAAAIAAAGV